MTFLWLLLKPCELAILFLSTGTPVIGYLFTKFSINAVPSSAGAWTAAKYDFIPGIFQLKVFQLFRTYFCQPYLPDNCSGSADILIDRLRNSTVSHHIQDTHNIPIDISVSLTPFCMSSSTPNTIVTCGICHSTSRYSLLSKSFLLSYFLSFAL